MTFRSIRAQRSGLVLATAVAAALTACQEPAPAGPYDLVIAGGRVLDPETGLDEVRNVGIRGGPWSWCPASSTCTSTARTTRPSA
jgi:hypothetical protein